MSADLVIHIRDSGISDKVLDVFQNMDGGGGFGEWEAAMELVGGTDHVVVGEVSWLKAALFEDEETFVPSPVMRISELIPETPPVEITEELVAEAEKAFALENTTSYDVGDGADVVEFLRRNIGREAFTASW